MNFTSNNIKSLVDLFRKELIGVVETNEIDNIIYWLLEEYAECSRIDIISGKKISVNESILIKLNNALKLLKKNTPIQYILGYTYFCGLKIHVNSSVLIPRSETEQLVEIITNDISDDDFSSILDIGTGSGCIAISLKKRFSHMNVSGIDVSEEALKTAKYNNDVLDSDVDFIYADILDDGISEKLNKTVDVIISNPPYVCEREIGLMRPNVYDYEPSLALFVPDDNPLLFYKRVVLLAVEKLSENGKLFFECNEKYSKDVKLLLRENNFKDIRIWNDLNEKPRFVSAKKGY